MNIKKNTSSMNLGIHNVLLAHYTWNRIINSWFWLESYGVLNAVAFTTVRKKIVFIMQTLWGFCFLLCHSSVRKRQTQLRKSYSVQCCLVHFKGLFGMKTTFCSKSNIISYNLRAKFLYIYACRIAQWLILDFRGLIQR